MEFTKRLFSKDREAAELPRMSLIDRIKSKFNFKSQDRKQPMVEAASSGVQKNQIG